ncbi:hypothetical protein ACI5KX_03805 [Erythrobacter sp. GH1-10]|uniref:hypothetical protein n=1 Tax=Erythrobacter sp. GH1-10 TaxID=3349334 RepID=UPI003877BB4E
MIDPSTLLVSLLLAAQPQADDAEDARDTSQTSEVAARKEVDDDDKIICRRTAVIGSKFKKRICATKEEWETLANQSRDATMRAQRRGQGLDPNGN